MSTMEYNLCLEAVKAFSLDDTKHTIQRFTKENVLEDSSEKTSHDQYENITSQFITLPLELRHEVYKHLMKPTQHYKGLKRNAYRGCYVPRPYRYDAPELLNLMLTCRQLYNEISDVLPSIATIHLSHQRELALMGHLGARREEWEQIAFWRLHPILRQGKYVTGRWKYDSYRPHVRPSIPIQVLMSNWWGWRKVEMIVNVHLRKDKTSPTQPFTDRLKSELTRIRRGHESIDFYVHVGEVKGILVTVLFRVQCRIMGRRVCSLLAYNGTVQSTLRYETLVDEDLEGAFCEVFDIPKTRTELPVSRERRT